MVAALLFCAPAFGVGGLVTREVIGVAEPDDALFASSVEESGTVYVLDTIEWTERFERDRARKRRAARPLVRALETAGGWVLSILGALAVSLALTWLLRHPQTLDSLMSAVRSILRLQ